MKKTGAAITSSTHPDRLVAIKSLTLLCGLLCLGCSGGLISEPRTEKLQQELDHSQVKLDTLREKLADVRLWQTRQQKTVDDYAAILLRQGFENYEDNREWQKRWSRAESYASTCRQLQDEINHLAEVVIPDIEVALQLAKGSN